MKHLLFGCAAIVILSGCTTTPETTSGTAETAHRPTKYAVADPLRQAITNNCDAAVVERLVAAGADVNATNAVGRTTFMAAAECNNHPEVIRKLAELGAPVNATNENGQVALWLAAKHNGSAEVMKILIAMGIDLHARNSLEETVLMEAAMWNPNPDVLDVLIQSGVDVDATDQFGHTALIYAVKYNSETEALERLVAAGADVNVRTKAGLTALHMACSNHDTNIVKRLALLGADVNAQKKNGRTALMEAGKFNSSGPVFRLLLKLGADENLQAKDGITALMDAAGFNNIDAIRLLLEKGADPAKRDASGLNAMDHARRRAERAGVTEESEACKMLRAAMPSRADDLPADKPESALSIGFAECYLKYNNRNGETEVILYDIRPSKKTALNKETFAQAFDLSEFEIKDVMVNESGDPPALRVLAKAKNFMLNTPVEQLFGSLLNTKATGSVEMDFPKQVTSIMMPMQKELYFADSNALGVYLNEDESQVMIKFDTSSKPMEIVIGRKQPETLAEKMEAKYQHDADIYRLRHLVYFGKLIEEYHTKTGSYPLQGASKLENYALVAAPHQQEYAQGGPPYEHATTDVETFRKTLEEGLGRKIDLKFDPQKVPVNAPNFYIYMIDGDTYYFAVQLYNPYSFTNPVGPHYNKVEITNAEPNRQGLWTFPILQQDPDFKNALQEKPAKTGWFEELEKQFH